ncbi:MAG TPA: 23S rRNA (adenine(2030)-N(6))-methyltransferase RlmJ [Rhodopila sp.]|uniref:23S rRNA (adenine(2030)-N(6))-methyltransferase RlmJ n=1 Tax=Rhodopila sp. TaxID=2480087 RepID=UPI002CFF1805|nr:23S rRNA (adenine(2030)-N(6))-methyltransferase RlmJ [Rhodopila sp.]HVY16280.1 23S rRNA (adenine(2030)-N(6))-methyltransferase RlmJ [Rhodopila sp.]
MNYRHAFHAGNFADCFKHALLVALLDNLARKPTPFCVMDTHAGSGRYDLSADAAQRTAEAEGGILRLLSNRDGAGPLASYLGLVTQLGLYPGSPMIIRALLRPGDRLVCCEKQPEEAAALKRLFRHDPQVEVHARSGWEALGALLPPREKRGLVFIDPPFEARDEFTTLVAALKTGHARFSHGIHAAWYPVKQLAAVHGFHADMKASGLRDVVTIEMHLRDPVGSERLNGCGMLVINPPYRFTDIARTLVEAVLEGLGTAEPGAGVHVLRLADE